jgi:MFS family permease
VIPATAAPDASWRRDFLRYWTGDVISTAGDTFTLIALPYAVFVRSHDIFQVAVVGAMPYLAVAVLGNLCGVWADRWPGRRVLIATEVSRMVLLVVLAVAVAVRRAPLWGLAVVVLAMGVLRSLHECAEAAAVAEVVPPEGLVWANARFESSNLIANLVGPAGAGLLIAVGGAGLALAADAATFGVSAAATTLVVALRRPPRSRLSTSTPSLLSELAVGFRRIWADRSARLMLCVGVGINITAIATDIQFIPYGRGVLHLSAAVLGLFFTWAAAIGLIAMPYVGRSKRVRGDVVVAGGAAFAAGILLAGLWPNVATATVAFAGAGVGSGLAFSHMGAFRQHRFESAELGRVTAAHRTALTAAMPLAILATGVLGHHLGSPAVFIAVGAIGLLACAIAALGGILTLRVG